MSLLETFANPGVSKAGEAVATQFVGNDPIPGEPIEAELSRETVKARGMGEFTVKDALPWILGGIGAAILVKTFGKN